MAHSNLAHDIIYAEQIADGQVTHAKLADDAVETNNIADGILTNGTRQGLIYAEVNLALTATVPIGTIPGGSLITEAVAVCSEATDGNGTQTFGDTGANDGIFTDANLTTTLNAVSGETQSQHGAYLFSTVKKTKWIASDTIFNGYIVKGTNTVGKLQVYIFYERGVMSG